MEWHFYAMRWHSKGSEGDDAAHIVKEYEAMEMPPMILALSLTVILIVCHHELCFLTNERLK